ncbi:hypothetical protein Tsubulata_001266 [Turnera subulata]|uniref:Neprosin activation peptide domain-containing protein n=1 Tax=Turnera subulata TaxID=218843 RepID=A0A9Q0FLG2_9ROSI|nr:hypothetical protein Tsubulata_001266 [Turnera subulata]
MIATNKTPIKTITTDYGDIFECIDILKQPALDHPLLKNHKIQMTPSRQPEEDSQAQTVSDSTTPLEIPPLGCPSGTVPIRKWNKEDFERAKYISNSFSPRIEEDGIAGVNQSVSY